ncbi:MAG: tyrosine-type recombinase/integrase [Thermodesulfovibrionales bacterium]
MGLFKRKDTNIWWMSFSYNGKQYRKSTGVTDKETAKKIYNLLISKLTLGQWIPEEETRTDYTFQDLVEKYLPYSQGRHRSCSRGYSIKKLARRFGSMKLTDITMEVIEGFQSELLKEGLQPGGVNRLVSLLKAMFTKAYDWKMIPEAHLKEVRRVKPLKGEKTRLRYLTVDEYERLLSECPKWLQEIVIFAANTGMRRGEILSLRWKDVDLKNGFILIPDSNTKTGVKREIPMNETVKRLLSSMVRPLNENETVFKPQVRIREVFEKACKRAGIRDFRFHDLRHTFASHLVMSGVDIQTVSKLLGHKSLTMTLRYAHLSPSYLAQGIKALDRALGRPNEEKLSRFYHGATSSGLTDP